MIGTKEAFRNLGIIVGAPSTGQSNRIDLEAKSELAEKKKKSEAKHVSK